LRNVVDKKFERRVAGLVNSGERGVLRGGRKGVERESLRVTPDGDIVHTPHPQALGAPLTNEHITTDFSESLIELVTPPFGETWELVQYLCDIHQFVYRHLGDELLWSTSMPGRIESDASIPLAQFGSSNIGRIKTIYRHGLGVRYGRIMQAIAGVHYNYSFPPALWDVLGHINQSTLPQQDFVSEQYFGVLRNYRRYGWLILYLFGTSPAVSKSFFLGRTADLPSLDRDTAYEPFGTSLRMSDVGYRNKNQATVSVSVNSLDEYVRDLSRAISTPYPPYQQIGVKVDGEYRQLNANILQIENEYYSYIRPKRIARSGERPTKALHRAGVEYVEVRALDVSAFDPVGVNQNVVPAARERADQPRRAGESGCQSSESGAPRPRARPHAEPRGPQLPDGGMGRRIARCDAGSVRDVGRGRVGPAVYRGTRTTAGEARRRGAHAVGASAQRDAPDRRIVHRAVAAHVDAAQGLFPGFVSAERAPSGRVRFCRAGVA
jgi:glutamate--cysteine ligase